MADKRFLGLGFTFAATDKGLEKKLKTIDVLTNSIADGLGSIAKGAQKASGGLGKLKGPPKGGQPVRSYVGRMARDVSHPAHERRLSEITEGHPGQTAAINKQLMKLFKDMGILGDVAKMDGVELSKFLDPLMDMKVTTQGAGVALKLSAHSLRDVQKATSGFIKQHEEYRKSVAKFPKIFAGIKDWIREIGSAADNFLQSLGIDLKKMIPPQIAAAGKLAGAALSPVKKIPGLIFGKKQEKLLTKATKQSGYKGVGASTLAKDMSKLISNTQPKEKSFLDMLKGGLSKLKSLAKMLLPMGLIGVLKAAYNWFKKLDILETIAKWAKFVADGFESIVDGLGEFLEPFAEIGAEIVVFGAAIAGFAVGFKETFGSLKYGVETAVKGFLHFAGSLITLGEALFGRVKELVDIFLAAHPAVKAVVDVFGDAASIVKNTFLGAVNLVVSGLKNLVDFIISIPKLIFEGFKNIGGLFNTLAGGALEKLGNKLFHLGDSIDETAKSINQGTRDLTGSVITQTTAPGGDTTVDKLDDLHQVMQSINSNILGLRKDTQKIGNSDVTVKVQGDMGKFMKAQDNAERKQLGGAGKTL